LFLESGFAFEKSRAIFWSSSFLWPTFLFIKAQRIFILNISKSHSEVPFVWVFFSSILKVLNELYQTGNFCPSPEKFLESFGWWLSPLCFFCSLLREHLLFRCWISWTDP
jgi:hypothetical protein